MPKGQITSFKDELKVAKLMELHCKRVGNYAVYQDGWSDESIAKETGVTLTAIKRIRKELIGSLQASTTLIQLNAKRRLAVEVIAQVACACADLSGKIGEPEFIKIFRELAQRLSETETDV